MSEVKRQAAENSAAFNLKPLRSDDVWDMLKIISKIGAGSFQEAIPSDLISKAKFKKPTMLDKKTGELKEIPRSKWTDRQKKAEVDAEVASEKISMIITGIVLNNIGNCKDEVNSMLARALDVPVENVIKMKAIEYVKLIYAFIGREEFYDFFNQALNSALTQMKLSTSSSASMGTI